MGIEPTSEAWELSETATYAPVSVRTNMSIRKERYWLRSSELAHGAKMYVMPQLGVRISWRERCKPGPRHHPRLQKGLQPGNFLTLAEPPTTIPSPPPSNYPAASAAKNTH
jgi:hypothetical protein